MTIKKMSQPRCTGRQGRVCKH